jgi:hypothetical protein
MRGWRKAIVSFFFSPPTSKKVDKVEERRRDGGFDGTRTDASVLEHGVEEVEETADLLRETSLFLVADLEAEVVEWRERRVVLEESG